MHTGRQNTLESTRRREHPTCWVCGTGSEGLGVEFRPEGDDRVVATFDCDPRYSGYQGFVHGGVVSSLLDGAMTSVLMARGKTSLTADLQVRFLEPVVVGQPAIVRAWLRHSRRRLSLLEAEIRQGTHLRATARARFLGRQRDDHRLVGSKVDDSQLR